MNIQWQITAFTDLSLQQLYQLLQLRAQVFCVEQACAYQDLDGIDQQAMHLLGYDGDDLVAYARLFINAQGESVIGRIVNPLTHRGLGIGKMIMQRSLDFIREQRWPATVYLMAQQVMEGFYQSFAFETQSAPFDEDGIAHIDMRRVLL